jgi:mRNA interferase MazF
MRVAPQSVWFFDLPQVDPTGHEQTRARPCIVVGNPADVQQPRFPVVMVVPLTTAALPDLPLYPRLAAGLGGLNAPATAMVDQMRVVDLARVRFRIGMLDDVAMRPILAGLRLLLRL